MLKDMDVKDILWSRLKCEGAPDNLIGVVYRKGDAPHDYNVKLLQQFEAAMSLCNDKLLIIKK